MNGKKLACALGLFSIGLGLAEALTPKRLGRCLGMIDRAGLLRVFGWREIATGVGILLRPRCAAGLWARVGGDALDLAALGPALTADNAKRKNAAIAVAAVAAIAVLDVVCAQQLARHDHGGGKDK